MKHTITSFCILALYGTFCIESAAAPPVTPVTYVGPNGGLWNNSSNWSPAAVPANSGSGSYSVAIATNPVVLNIAGTTAINDLTLSNTLTLNAGCSLSASGQIGLAEANITSNGGNFVASGPSAAATDLSLNASGGAQLALPALSQIADIGYPFGSMQANGAGSLLDLSSVSTIAVNNIFTSAQANTGGIVNLHNLLSVTSSSGNSMGLNASGGMIDISNLAVGTSNSAALNVSLSNSGTVLWGSPTGLSLIGLAVTGTGNTIDVSHVATASDLSLNASGGAQLALPALTQIADISYPFGSMQANGAGSLLNLSSVSSIAVNNIFTSAQANTGGVVNLHNLLSVTSSSGNSMGLTASGGTIDISNLAVGMSNSAALNVSLSNTGTVLWGSPASLRLIGLTVTGTGNTIDVSHVATATDLSLNASGGAQLALPALTQIADISYPFGSMQANGAGSLLNLSSVTTIAVNNIFTSAQANTGGMVNLHNLLSVTSSSGNSMALTASGGTIDIANLAVGMSNSAALNVSLSNTGAVLWGSPASLKLIGLTVTGTGNTIDVSHVATASDLSLNASGGAQLALPALTQIADISYPFGSMQANGAGSLLDLSHVSTIAVNNIFTSAQANSGGMVNLHNLLSVTSSSGNSMGLTASGGTIDISNLAVGTSNSAALNVSLSNSGTVLWGSPTSLRLIGLTVTGTGNTIDVSHVATASDLSLKASGGAQLALPALTQIADISYPFGSMQANGAGSLLDLSSVSTIAVNNIFTSVQASSSGVVNLHNLLSVTSSSGNSMGLNASGGTIDVSSLRRLTGSIQIGGGGAVLLSGSGSISRGITVSGGSTESTQGVLDMSGAIGSMEFTDSVASDTDLTIGGNTIGEPALLDFRLGSTADHLLLDAGKLVVDPGGGQIAITPQPGLAAGVYDLIDFNSGQASGLGGLTLATASLPGFSLRLQSTATSEQLVVTAVPEPPAMALVAVFLGSLLVLRRAKLTPTCS
jgi:hypothetical protein